MMTDNFAVTVIEDEAMRRPRLWLCAMHAAHYRDLLAFVNARYEENLLLPGVDEPCDWCSEDRKQRP